MHGAFSRDRKEAISQIRRKNSVLTIPGAGLKHIALSARGLRPAKLVSLAVRSQIQRSQDQVVNVGRRGWRRSWGTRRTGRRTCGRWSGGPGRLRTGQIACDRS